MGMVLFHPFVYPQLYLDMYVPLPFNFCKGQTCRIRIVGIIPHQYLQPASLRVVCGICFTAIASFLGFLISFKGKTYFSLFCLIFIFYFRFRHHLKIEQIDFFVTGDWNFSIESRSMTIPRSWRHPNILVCRTPSLPRG